MEGTNINFHSECSFLLKDSTSVINWLGGVSTSEGKKIGQLNYIFCDDSYLHKINLEFLKHDTYTDIITFDDSLGDELIADIYISIERVEENASIYSVSFQNELYRVIVHGLLHLCGYTDKTDQALDQMRGKEDKYLAVLL
tara:strand:+ start:921 stop:1343 length:423 start_codon:yes stop_codon:yes gene_type:complete